MNRMDGKICVITGATQGLGRQLPAGWPMRGTRHCHYRAQRGTGAALAHTLTADSGMPTVFIRADLESVEDCRAVIDETHRHFGRVDVLVNAGALTERGTILDTDPELFDRIFATNVRGPYFLMQEAIRNMIRDGIEGPSAISGPFPRCRASLSSAPTALPRGALATLTANTAFSVMANRIRVNQLNIGWMASDKEREIQLAETNDPDWMEKAASRLPFGRLVTPEEAARAVNFPCIR
ncbi:oxidoreductase [Komagataeibacter rhaeticus]|nr:oxidoreductase [Komagataeibacter rhaeticus]